MKSILIALGIVVISTSAMAAGKAPSDNTRVVYNLTGDNVPYYMRLHNDSDKELDVYEAWMRIEGSKILDKFYDSFK